MERRCLTDAEAREKILAIGKKMSDTGFVSANDGNLALRVGPDAIWATPTGVNKGELRADMLVKLRISDGAVLEGTWKPTTEIQMHLNAFRQDDEIVSTAHAHPLNLCVLACAGIELDLPTTPAACCVAARVPVLPYYCSGSPELAQSIIPYVKKYHVVNLGNHGPIAWGKTPDEAWYRLESAEAAAKLALELARLGRLRPLSAGQVRELFDFHGFDISPEATVRAAAETDNQSPAISFSAFFRALTQG